MCEQFTPNDHVTCQIEHGDDVMSTVDVLWVVVLAFPDVVCHPSMAKITVMHATFLVWLIFAAPYQTNRK
jgi:hypothetical protein